MKKTQKGRYSGRGGLTVNNKEGMGDVARCHAKKLRRASSGSKEKGTASDGGAEEKQRLQMSDGSVQVVEKNLANRSARLHIIKNEKRNRR